jgi:hypothetical protein
MEVSGQLHAQAALLSWERAPCTHLIGGWVGPRAGLDAVAKRRNPIIALTESNPGRPVRRLVTILTELPRLPFCMAVDNFVTNPPPFFGVTPVAYLVTSISVLSLSQENV